MDNEYGISDEDLKKMKEFGEILEAYVDYATTFFIFVNTPKEEIKKAKKKALECAKYLKKGKLDKVFTEEGLEKIKYSI